MSGLLLFSGGVDSTAVAALSRPDLLLHIDYGQLCAEGERAAATFGAERLQMPMRIVQIDCRPLGTGLLAGEPQLTGAPTPEWFPFRNQLLVTIGAAVAVKEDLDSVLVGLVKTDGARHRDGTPAFIEAISSLVESQEGNVRVVAPFADRDPSELIRRASLDSEHLHRTFSCHRANIACGSCPGCLKRAQVLRMASNS